MRRLVLTLLFTLGLSASAYADQKTIPAGHYWTFQPSGTAWSVKNLQSMAGSVTVTCTGYKPRTIKLKPSASMPVETDVVVCVFTAGPTNIQVSNN